MDCIRYTFLHQEKKVRIKRSIRGGLIESYLLGLTFSIGWTPCVGPVLATLLGVAGSQGLAFYVAFLMLIYLSGLSIPFLILSLFVGYLLERFRRLNKYLNIIRIISGVLIIIMGIILMSNNLNWITLWFVKPPSISCKSFGGINMKNRNMIMVTVIIVIVILVFSACTPKQNNTATATPEVNKQAAQQQENRDVKKLNENIDTANEFTGNAYNFELYDIEGNIHKLSDYVGKKVYIKFWATWCSVCISGMPDFLEFVEQNKDNQELVILTIVSPGVSGEMDTERFKDWYQKQGMNFNVLLDENGSVMREYGIKGFPTSVFVDTSGNIAKENIGHIDNNEIDQTLSEMQ